ARIEERCGRDNSDPAGGVVLRVVPSDRNDGVAGYIHQTVEDPQQSFRVRVRIGVGECIDVPLSDQHKSRAAVTTGRTDSLRPAPARPATRGRILPTASYRIRSSATTAYPP